MTRILFATSEARPLVKTGGLADVSGALPAALCEIGEDCRLLLPGYHGVLGGVEGARELHRFDDLPHPVRLLEADMPDSGVALHILDAPHYYLREGGPYQDADGADHPDNAERFGLLSRVAALLASPRSPLAWRPEVLHCNDWQTGLAPAWLKFAGGGARSLMTVHNLAFQGIFPADWVARLGLPPESFAVEGLEYYGNLSFLKAGLHYADALSTVSPSYAEEIQSEPLGMGLQGLLARRRADLAGIVNGIDTAYWNPRCDPYLPCSYSVRGLSGKKRCKAALQKDLNLEADPAAPLLGMVSRLTHQKGVDLVLEIADRLVRDGAQLAILGAGEAGLEAACRALAQRHAGRAATVIGYDEGLAHRIEAGADLFLMPSRFEPCGLNQMYSQRYGTPPLVHATGGLRDTVVDATPENLAADTATGFVFEAATAAALQATVQRALALYGDAAAWKRLQLAGMRRDFSWEHSAREYRALYRRMLAED